MNKKNKKETGLVILKTPRARQNDCVGFCIGCVQADVKPRITEKGNYFFYRCILPQVHSISLRRKK